MPQNQEQTRDDSMRCENCGEQCYRDEVDVEVGIIYGPWGCACGWSEWLQYNQFDGEAEARTDPWGGVYPEGNPVPWRQGMAHGEAQALYRFGVEVEEGR